VVPEHEKEVTKKMGNSAFRTWNG